MACVSITNVCVLDNPTRFDNPFQVRVPARGKVPQHVGDRACGYCTPMHAFVCCARPFGRPPPAFLTSCMLCMPALAQFELSFECISEISDDIEWKLIYVGSAESDEHDQLLDSVLVGPMQVSARPLPCACSSSND